jgi:hypothetical protein
MMVIMAVEGAPLKIHEVSPYGIVNLELAGTISKAASIYQSWQPNLIDTAITNTFLDFIFILLYGTFLFTASYSFLKKNQGWLKKVNQWVCIGSLIAPVFDVIENVLMFRTLSGHFSKEVVASTFFFAAIKFILAGLTILFLIFSQVTVSNKKEMETSVV